MTPTLLLILDGWGIAPAGPGNAISQARTPNLDDLTATCPNGRLEASGLAVGLPRGYMGNSEVGHLNIGAGRVIYQDMTRIDLALEDGSFAKVPALTDLLGKVRGSGGTLHLIGLLSDGGVHSHIEHLKALCDIAAVQVPVAIHCIMDGRDTDPKSGVDFIAKLQAHIATLPGVRIATCVGRYYAMDRDTRWDRVKTAWDCYVHGIGEATDDMVAAIKASYAADVTDEFVRPLLAAGEGPTTVRDGDGIFFFNFRADRMRELVQAFSFKDFGGFDRGTVPTPCGMASMTAYDAHFTLPVAFPKESVEQGLGETVSSMGLRQLRLAETEKYAHVTYFFNGGREEPFEREDRILIDSPRDVATYDLKPSMSALEVTAAFEREWARGVHDLVVCNLANGDMVGHTGVLPAAIAACETVDQCVGRMRNAVAARGGRMLIIADHGNCETMLTPDGRPHTAHTTNPVPCILLDPDRRVTAIANGCLADVATTILGLWGVPPSPPMKGKNLAG
ncbi:MAG: 2,3-bisphosphoglycerate-independent phosphoglycerate mutase [Desulfovibrio sp.]|jgi:2,3-bisphosphoglycerate-independent phosphoglycerate mutase|nr:2,3-bisphosphoglycerate-independent phosphoglycerate mutase [Desulfovibrio sp.]